MTGPIPYLYFDGDAAAALGFYRGVFGGETETYTFAEFSREDGPGDRVAHGMLRGTVSLFASDTGEGEPAVRLEGVLFSLLGVAEPATLRAWFDALSDGGTVIDPLQERAWGASDGIVADRYGIRWLIGYEG